MKLLATLLVIFFPLSGWSQSVGGSGSGGGLRQRALTYGCEEGRIGNVSVKNEEGRYQVVRRVCVNGSYMTSEERASYVYNPRTRLCKEGSLTSFSDRDLLQDSTVHLVHKCQDGKWIPYR